MKKEPKISTMEQNELIGFLESALMNEGFNDLAKVDIFKSAILIRDPITKEMTVPFETRPAKTDDSRNISWQKVHQDTLKHKDDMPNLKDISINQSSTIENKSNRTIANRDYSIATDSNYIKVNHNEMTRKLYQFNKDKAVSVYFRFTYARHAAIVTIKVSKDGRKLRSVDLSDTARDMNLVNENVKKWMDVTGIKNKRVLTS